ncbi:hypothetical protein F8388_011487 [Cannabis sativa]|uniref:Lipid desaturase domain-containing protein n=1 Tax=Cannabis sativa TaxID=3483 RepID=A0A7J6G421_CANSA|nr:hypothetical protein F8388_011487 [Cannabis sativa]
MTIHIIDQKSTSTKSPSPQTHPKPPTPSSPFLKPLAPKTSDPSNANHQASRLLPFPFHKSPSSTSYPSRTPLQKSAPSNRSLNRLSFSFSKPAVSLMDLFASSTSPRVDDGVLVDFTGYGRWWHLLMSTVTQNVVSPIVIDPTYLSTWSHRIWVATGCTVVLVSFMKSIIIGAPYSSNLFVITLAGLVGYVMADLLSGVYHWAIDNYGTPSTPFFGEQVKEFQGHHMLPCSITKRQFANNVHALARAVTFAVLPLNLLCHDPIVHGFPTNSCLVSQHYEPASASRGGTTRSRHYSVAIATRCHHRPPYNTHYCIFQGPGVNATLSEQKGLAIIDHLIHSFSEVNSIPINILRWVLTSFGRRRPTEGKYINVIWFITRTTTSFERLVNAKLGWTLHDCLIGSPIIGVRYDSLGELSSQRCHQVASKAMIVIVPQSQSPTVHLSIDLLDGEKRSFRTEG